MIISLLKAYLSDITLADISKSFTYSMVVENNWHKYRMKLCRCHCVYTEP